MLQKGLRTLKMCLVVTLVDLYTLGGSSGWVLEGAWGHSFHGQAEVLQTVDVIKTLEMKENTGFTVVWDKTFTTPHSSHLLKSMLSHHYNHPPPSSLWLCAPLWLHCIHWESPMLHKVNSHQLSSWIHPIHCAWRKANIRVDSQDILNSRELLPWNPQGQTCNKPCLSSHCPLHAWIVHNFSSVLKLLTSLSCTEYLCLPPHPKFICWRPNTNVTVFGDGTFKEGFKVQWGHKNRFAML